MTVEIRFPFSHPSTVIDRRYSGIATRAVFDQGGALSKPPLFDPGGL